MIYGKLAGIGMGLLAATAYSGVVLAQGVPQLRGSLGAEYSRSFVSDGGDEANLWSTTGDIVVGLGATGLHAQGNASYGQFDTSPGSSVDIWNIAGSLFWRASQGVLGATIGYVDASSADTTIDYVNYGLFGEAYVTDTIWLVGRGGLFDGSGIKGGYYGGGLRIYATPNLALAGRVDVTDIQGAGGNVLDYSANAEYLMAAVLPLSLYAGYTYTDTPGGGPNVNSVTPGLRVYFGGYDGESLAEQNRNGAVREPIQSLEFINL